MSHEHEPKPQYTVERMTPDDVEAVTRMRLQSWLDTYVNDEAGVTREWIEARNQVQLSPEKEMARRERLANPNVAGWVAKSFNGEVIGATTPYRGEDGVQHVGSLYVDKLWHGTGVGSTLMQKVINWADPTEPLELGVVSYNERAKAFYRKWGFEEVAGSETLFDDTIPEVKMVRRGDLETGIHAGTSMEKEARIPYRIREATRDDAEKARVMQAQSWLATYPNIENGVPPQWVQEQTNSWLTPERIEGSREILGNVLDDPTQFYRLAEVGDTVVGFVHVATNDDGTKELEAIYTSPETFGTGLGARLMMLANEWIDGETTTLQVASYNERAIRFYEKYGFEKVEHSERLYKGKIPIITMIRKGDVQ